MSRRPSPLTPLFLIFLLFFLVIPAMAQDLNHALQNSANLAPSGNAKKVTCSPTSRKIRFEQIALNRLPGVSGAASPLSSSKEPKGHSFAAFWEVGGGYTSTLILRNKDSRSAVSVNVVLFSRDGSIEQRVPFEVEPTSVGRLSLSGVVKPEGQSIHWGGLMLEFPNVSASTTIGDVIIENYEKGIIFDLPLFGGLRYDTENTLHASWWLMDSGTDGTVTLFNVSNQNIVVSPSIIVKDTERPLESLGLAAHEAKKLSLRDILRRQNLDASRGSIVLRYTGPAHALAPTVLLANPATGFSLLSSFSARHDKVESGQVLWRFPDVFLSGDSTLGFNSSDKLTAYALVSNPTKSPIAPQFTAYVSKTGDKSASISLPIAPLKPLETRLINISQFEASGLLPDNIPYASLAVTHKGVPGDLGLTVFSVGRSKDFVSRSEGLVRSGQIIDSTYWDISGDLVALLLVQNAGDTPVQSKATLYYQTPHGTASYNLPPIDVPGNGSRVLNLKQIISSAVPDSNGKTIPAKTTFGTVTLEVADKSSHQLIFGGSTSFDPVKGRYGLGGFPPNCDLCDVCEICVEPTDTGGVCEEDCSDPSCCGPPLPNPFIETITPNQVSLGTTSITVKLTGTFNSNPSVSVSPSGISAGNVTVNSDGSLSVPFTISNSAKVQNYTVTESDDGGSATTNFGLAPAMTVSGSNEVNAIFVGSDPGVVNANSFIAQVNPTGGTFSATSSDASDTFSQTTLGGFPKVNITTKDQSQSNGDRTLTFKYTVNSVTATQTMAVTARQFAFAGNLAPSNTCSLGNGFDDNIEYTPFTHPDGTEVPPGIGLSGTIVAESFQNANNPTPCKFTTGNGNLDVNSQFSDRIAQCSSQPIPTCSTTTTQSISVGGFSVRSNKLVITNTNLTFTNLGPTQ